MVIVFLKKAGSLSIVQLYDTRDPARILSLEGGSVKPDSRAVAT